MKSRLSSKVLSVLLAGFVALACMGMVGVPALGFAEEAADVALEQNAFVYEHNPVYNPSCMRDVVVNPDAVYGFSPNPDSGSLTKYASYDWTDPKVVAEAQASRLEYFASMQEMFDLMDTMQKERKSIEEIARAVSAKRNEIRLASYEGDPEGLAAAKAHNLQQYGNENGPTPEYLFEKYGSWESVLDHAFSTNSGMDACCGLYDKNYDKYVMFGQIPAYQVSFDVAGRTDVPESQKVYAGECAEEPAAPQAGDLVFVGWCANDEFELFDFSDPIVEDTVLAAVWEREPVASVVVAEDAPVANLSADLNAANLLSNEERTLVDGGAIARVWVEVGPTAADKETQDGMATAVAEKLGTQGEVACYVDLSLWKQLETDDEPMEVHELGEKMSVTLTLSDEQIPDDADKRSWCVSREHEGAVEVLDATFDAATKTVTFSTEKFSSFAVAYSEAQEQQAKSGSSSTRTYGSASYLSRKSSTTGTTSKAGTPGTADPTNLVMPLTSLIAGGSLLGLGMRKQR